MTWWPPWALIAASARSDSWIAVACVVRRAGDSSAPGRRCGPPITPALVNDLATDELRGRYNALSPRPGRCRVVIGPAVAGLLIGSGLAAVWVALTVGRTASGPRCSSGLRRHLTDAQDGVSRSRVA